MVLVLAAIVDKSVVVGTYSSYRTPVSRPSAWKLAHATFYGDETASATSGGACGYGNLFSNGYGGDTAALSTVLFNNGYACGQCFQIRCTESPYCYKGSPIATVTATNLCPPNWSEDGNNGGWVPCARHGGVKFSIQGNGYWLLVYVMNVAGGGDIAGMWVKGSKTGWVSMSHNWGASYQAFAALGGQTLSFKLTSYTTHETIVAYNVAPSNWNAGMTYQAAVNFH
nr:putative expansin-A30 [Ipomoea batatas]